MNELVLESVEYHRDIGDYLSALNRRKAPLLITAAVILSIVVLVALLLPPAYRSTATILIEQQEIPQDLVRPTITSYADQRIQVISQQVMTRANLMKIVDKYELYAPQRQKETVEEIIERMRKDIKLDLVTTDVTDRRLGGKMTATIAFTLSYDSVSPEKAQKVANELTSLYLNENLQSRKQKAEEVSSFLAEEAERLKVHIDEIEGHMASFKLKNQGRLPELAQVNMQMRDRAEVDLSDLERQETSSEERRFYLQSQLAQIKPNTPIMSSTGDRIQDPEDRLKSLRAQYAGLEGLYSLEHPDMIRMRKQIAALERETALPQDGSEEAKQLEKLRTNLATVREQYSDDHPDVVKLKNTIAALEASISSKPATNTPPTKKAENPAYVTLEAQLQGLEAGAKDLAKHKAELRSRLGMLESRLEKMPMVEKDYLEMVRDRENSVTRYREIRAKLMEAEVAQDLERDRKSERFSLIDPPQMPEKPRSPDRPVILLMGVLLAAGGGIASVGLLEALDSSVRNSKDLARTISAPMLSAVPYILTQADLQKEEVPRKRLFIAGATILVGGLLAVHFFWMPLEVIWFSILRRLGAS